MLRFKAHQVQVGRRRYILLPKLNSGQLLKFADRLTRVGYRMTRSGSLKARSGRDFIHVYPEGVCWSTVDPSDAVLPVISEILESPKEQMELAALKTMYLRLVRSGRAVAAGMSARIESYSIWDRLRAADGCALAPDEHAVASFLMSNCEACDLLTDFFAEGSLARWCGRKRYYASILDGAQAAATLRVVGTRATRNSYVHRDGHLRLRGFATPSREAWLELFGELGDWCSFAPS